MIRYPTVSVIIPTYNRAHLVGRAIQSVLEQTYQNFEIIVVDDASTDDMEEVVKGFSDQRIHYFRHEQNKGGGAARNTGVKKARGDFIAFLDSDDEWFPSKIEKQLRIFYKGNAKLGAIGTGISIYSTRHESKIKIPSGSFGNIHKKLLQGNSWPGSTSTIMIKRECFKKVGLFDELLEAGQEYDLYIRIAKHYYFDVVRELLVKKLKVAHSISSNMNARLQGCKMLLLKHSKDIPRLSQLRGRFNFEIGVILCRQNNISEARKYLLKAVIAYPFTLKYWINFLFSVFPYSRHLLVLRKT